MFHFGRGRLGGRVRGKWEGWRKGAEGRGRGRGRWEGQRKVGGTEGGGRSSREVGGAAERWEEQQRGGRSSREVGGAAERWEGHNVHEDHSFNGSADYSDSMC